MPTTCDRIALYNQFLLDYDLFDSEARNGAHENEPFRFILIIQSAMQYICHIIWEFNCNAREYNDHPA